MNNPGFELGLVDWNVFTNTETITSDAYLGGNALSLSSNASGVDQTFSVIEGESYTVSAYAKNSGVGWSGLGLSFFDRQSNELDETVIQITSPDWTEYTLDTIAPSGAVSGVLWAWKGGDNGITIVDEFGVSGTTPPPSEERLSNPSFENGLNDWDLFTGNETTTSEAYDGDQSLLLNTNFSGVSQSFDISPGEFYRFSSYAQSDSNSWSGLGVDFYDANGTRLETPASQINTADWSKYSIEGMAPSNATTIVPWLYNDSGRTLFDQVSFQVVRTVPSNQLPMITSNGGGNSASLNIEENNTAVANFNATDLDGDSEGNGLTYTLEGTDLSQLSIAPETGVLSFISAPDFENPVDANGDNQYNVDVVVTDSEGGRDRQSLTIIINDVNDEIVPGVIYFDDFETNQGWVVNPNNSDTATTGQWEVANPAQTSSNGIVQQLGTTVSGTQALVTQALAGTSVGTYDIDNGITSVRSPQIVLQDNADFTLEFNYYLAHLDNANSDDFLKVTVVGQQNSQVVLEQRGDGSDRAAVWTAFTTDISEFAGETISLLVEAQDGGTPSLVEGGIDDLVINIASLDIQAPSATLNASNITAEGTNFYTFDVTYSDDTAVDVSTIDAEDIQVTGPNGFNQTATLVSIDNNSVGSPRTATYRLSAPGGLWNGDDNGLYNVFLNANQISDLRGNAVTTSISLGDFTVNLNSNVLPLGSPNFGVAATDNATGTGYLMYSEELVEVRFFGNGPAADNASNLIAVQFDNGQWFYDNDTERVAFNPRNSDRLLARLDFSNDSAFLLTGTNQTIEGIAAGYATGDLAITPNWWNGNADIGEFGVTGTQVVLFGNGSEVPGQFNFSASTVTVDESTDSVTLTIDRLGGTDGVVTVDYTTTAASATSGEDYTESSGTLTFNDGETQKTISIDIINDSFGEGEESFVVSLTNASDGASIGLGSTIVTINENDGGPDPGNPGDLLPDLRPIANTSSDYTIDTERIPGQVLLRLSTEVANIGEGPLELWGTGSSADIQPVFQRLYDEDGGSRDRLAGEFVNHPSHGHIHFEGFALYNLREINPDGSVGTIVGSGGKTSFCLININQPFPELTNSAIVSDGRGGDNCGLVQGIDVGYSDVYGRNLPDQWIDITNLQEGDYWLEIIADPENNIVESDETNNVGYLQVSIENPLFG